MSFRFVKMMLMIMMVIMRRRRKVWLMPETDIIVMGRVRVPLKILRWLGEQSALVVPQFKR